MPSSHRKINNMRDFWEKLNSAEKREIKRGIHQLEQGQRISFEDVLKRISCTKTLDIF